MRNKMFTLLTVVIMLVFLAGCSNTTQATKEISEEELSTLKHNYGDVF